MMNFMQNMSVLTSTTKEMNRIYLAISGCKRRYRELDCTCIIHAHDCTCYLERRENELSTGTREEFLEV